MKVIITGDNHLDCQRIGKVNPLTDLDLRVEDFINAFDKVVDYAFKNDAELFIINGDLFKGRTSTHLIETLVAERFRKISEKMELWLVLGNHDFTSKGISYDTHAYSIIEKTQPTNIKVFKTLAYEKFKGHDFIIYPYYDTKLRKEFKTNQEIVNFIETTINSFPIKKDQTIFVGHGTPEGTKIANSWSFDLSQIEEPIIPKSLLEQFEMAFFSHIHRHHSIGKKIMHVGSIERIDFAEAKDPKGFVCYDTETKESKFISTNPRPMQRIKLSVVKEVNPTEKILEEIEKLSDLDKSLVQVEITCTEQERKIIDHVKIKEKLEQAFHYKYKTQIEREETKTRLESVTEIISDEKALELVVNNNELLTDADKAEIIKRGKRILLLNEA